MGVRWGFLTAGGSDFFSKKTSGRKGGVYSGPQSMLTAHVNGFIHQKRLVKKVMLFQRKQNRGATKSQRKIITNTRNCYFFKLFSHFGFRYIKLNISMQEIKFTSHKLYLLGHLFPRNGKKSYTDQSTLQDFLFCPD